MNRFQDIELFIFDCDGVLVDTEVLANRVFIEEITKLGFTLSAEEAWEHFPGTRFAKCVEYVEQTNQKKVPEEFLEVYRSKSQYVFDTEMQSIPGIIPVSYTHLDVYKRQGRDYSTWHQYRFSSVCRVLYHLRNNNLVPCTHW